MTSNCNKLRVLQNVVLKNILGRRKRGMKKTAFMTCFIQQM